jgi:hypothetical protein
MDPGFFYRSPKQHNSLAHKKSTSLKKLNSEMTSTVSEIWPVAWSKHKYIPESFPSFLVLFSVVLGMWPNQRCHLKELSWSQYSLPLHWAKYVSAAVIHQTYNPDQMNKVQISDRTLAILSEAPHDFPVPQSKRQYITFNKPQPLPLKFFLTHRSSCYLTSKSI